MSSIAFDHGFFWETLWNHPDNADLKRLRKNPNILLAGDVVVIPDLRPRHEAAATEQRHRFRRKGVPEYLRMVVLDSEDQPRTNTPYRLDIDGDLRSGTTDSQGFLEEVIPPNASRGNLVVGEGDDADEYSLLLGNLDPIDTSTGVQGRLANLGYDVGPIDGNIGPRTRDAIKQFQRAEGMESTGEMDAPTLQKLKDLAAQE